MSSLGTDLSLISWLKLVRPLLRVAVSRLPHQVLHSVKESMEYILSALDQTEGASSSFLLQRIAQVGLNSAKSFFHRPRVAHTTPSLTPMPIHSHDGHPMLAAYTPSFAKTPDSHSFSYVTKDTLRSTLPLAHVHEKRRERAEKVC